MAGVVCMMGVLLCLQKQGPVPKQHQSTGNDNKAVTTSPSNNANNSALATPSSPPPETSQKKDTIV